MFLYNAQNAMIQQEMQQQQKIKPKNSSVQEISPIFKTATAAASGGIQVRLNWLWTENCEAVNFS